MREEVAAISFTAAVASDARALSDIARTAKAYWGYADSWLEMWADQFVITPQFLSRNWVLVARADKKPIGFIAIDQSFSPPEIVHLWILPPYQRRRIGKQLVEAAIAEAKRIGATELAIDSDPNAESFYLACGAVRVGVVAAPMPGAVDRVLPRFSLNVNGLT